MNKREQTLTDRAAQHGWNLEQADTDWRITNSTGTLVAAVWTNPDGYGLTLDDIEHILEGTYHPTTNDTAEPTTAPDDMLFVPLAD